MIEEIKIFEFSYSPWNRNFPIKKCKLTIYAKDRKEAELIALENGYKFFDEDCTVQVSTVDLQGYRHIVDIAKKEKNK